MQVLVIGRGSNKERTDRQAILDYIINNKDNIIVVAPKERRLEEGMKDIEFPLDILTLTPEPKTKKSKSWNRKRKRDPWE